MTLRMRNIRLVGSTAVCGAIILAIGLHASKPDVKVSALVLKPPDTWWDYPQQFAVINRSRWFLWGRFEHKALATMDLTNLIDDASPDSIEYHALVYHCKEHLKFERSDTYRDTPMETLRISMDTGNRAFDREFLDAYAAALSDAIRDTYWRDDEASILAFIAAKPNDSLARSMWRNRYLVGAVMERP